MKFLERQSSLYLLLAEVAPLVVLHVALGAEALTTAKRADERSHIRVNPVVNQQILLLAKSFPALREIAPERLCSVVQVHVGVQPNFALELLLKSVLGTRRLF